MDVLIHFFAKCIFYTHPRVHIPWLGVYGCSPGLGGRSLRDQASSLGHYLTPCTTPQGEKPTLPPTTNHVLINTRETPTTTLLVAAEDEDDDISATLSIKFSWATLSIGFSWLTLPPNEVPFLPPIQWLPICADRKPQPTNTTPETDQYRGPQKTPGSRIQTGWQGRKAAQTALTSSPTTRPTPPPTSTLHHPQKP